MTYVIGLTGGICSGKSTLANVFRKNHIPVIDADQIARDIVLPGTPALNEIVKHFGHDILNEGALDRKKLRHIIFQDGREKKWLEKLLHPLIFEEIQKQIKSCSSSICLVDIPLLTESYHSYQNILNEILVIDTSEAAQIERLMARDHCSQETALTILATQANRQERLKIADQVLANTSDLSSLITQAEKLVAYYQKKAKIE